MGNGSDFLTVGELSDYEGLVVIRCERCRRERHMPADKLRKPRSTYVMNLRFRCAVCRRISRHIEAFTKLRF